MVTKKAYVQIRIKGPRINDIDITIDGVVIPTKSLEVFVDAGEMPMARLLVPIELLEYYGEAKVVVESLKDD